MSEVLVVIDHANGELKASASELLGVAAGLGAPVAVLVGEPGVAEGLAAHLGAAGATKVYVSENADAASNLLTPLVAAVTAAAEKVRPSAILMLSTFDGRELAGRLAVRLDGGVLADVVGVELAGDEVVATQSVFGGEYTMQYKVTRGIPILAVRGGAIEATAESVSAPEIITLDAPFDAATAVRIASWHEEASGDRPELAAASVVVSGGRGVGSADKFSVVEDLADALGGAVGASRAAVDSGYYPHQFQVGQTGTTVSPQLYIALGVSGAIQHRAGMQTSKTIVAVNKDADAPIFEIADYGVVGDLFDVTPALTEAVKARKG